MRNQIILFTMRNGLTSIFTFAFILLFIKCVLVQPANFTSDLKKLFKNKN